MNKFTFSSLLLVFLFLSFQSKAQWKKMDIDGGLSRRVVKTDSFVYMISQTTLYKSDLNLSKWDKVAVTFPYLSTVYSEDNVLMVIKSGSNSPIKISKNNGVSWNSIPYDTNNFVVNLIKFQGANYLVMQNKNRDTTLLYRLQNDSLKKISTYPINYSIFSSQDTIFYRNYSTNRFYYSTNIDSLTIIPQDLFIDKLNYLVKYQGKFYGVYQGKSIYFSTGDGYWRKINNFPAVNSVNSYNFVDSTLFFNSSEGGKVVLYCRPNPNGIWIKLNPPNINFNNIIRIGNNYIYSTQNGIYLFTLTNSWSFKMNGVQHPSLSGNMYKRGEKVYLNIRDSLFSTSDNGQTVQTTTPTGFNAYSSAYFSFNNINFIISNGILYRADPFMQNFSKCILPDSNFFSSVFAGVDDSSIYFTVKNKSNNGAYVLSSKDGLSFRTLNNFFNGKYFRVKYIYYDKDTLFALDESLKTEYYSITKGNSWEGSKGVLPNYIQYPISGGVLKKFAGNYFLHLVEYGKIDDIDHFFIKQKGKWVYASSNLHYVFSSECFSLDGISFRFESKNKLLYTLDSLKTFKNTNIDFNVAPGQYILGYLFTQNSIYVEMSGGGIYYRSFSMPTSVVASKKKPVVKLYPNPVKEVIHLQLNNPAEEVKSISIYSMQGMLISEYHSENIETIDGVASINIQPLVPGNYIARMITNERVYSSKFMVQ